jgi:hypothetical protein
MVTNSFGNRNFMQPRLSVGRGGGGGFFSFFFCSQDVPFKFLMGSHQVPKRVPNSTSL